MGSRAQVLDAPQLRLVYPYERTNEKHLKIVSAGPSAETRSTYFGREGIRHNSSIGIMEVAIAHQLETGRCRFFACHALISWAGFFGRRGQASAFNAKYDREHG